MKSPFKFLDPYGKEDRDIFFGREREIDELYHRVFESRIMLVYGESGTGKSSLVHCGLANKFRDTDWLPLNIRRGDNIIESTASAIQDSARTPQNYKLISTSLFKKAVRSLYIDYYKPIFFIFDQFEELFIFGSKEEKNALIQLIKALIESDIQCRFIFIMREEYIAGITEFEIHIPTFLGNRVRIEKMPLASAILAIRGPCIVYNISLDNGFAEKLLEKLNPGSPEVELTYLQVFLDKIYRLAQSEQITKEADPGNLSFTTELIDRTGDVSDLLGSFLDEQISLQTDPGSALAVLKSFVSVKGTKRQLTPDEVKDYSTTLGKEFEDHTLVETISRFVNLRILRDKDQNGRYELRHDSLATKIYEDISLVEREILEIRQFIDNAYDSWKKRGVFLSSNDLDYIAPYRSRLFLSAELNELLLKSQNALVRMKRRKRNIAIASPVLLIIVLSVFTIWALKERNLALKRENQARANYLNYISTDITSTDPTIGLMLADYALKLDTGNKTILNNRLRIYYDNSLYRKRPALPDLTLACFTFSPDVKYFAAAYGDNTIRIMDADGNILYRLPRLDSPVFAMAFSWNDQKIVAGTFDGTVIMWDLSGKDVRSVKLSSNRVFPVENSGNSVVAVTFAGKEMNILAGYRDGNVVVWDSAGKLLIRKECHKSGIRSLAASEKNGFIVTASDDTTAILWDKNWKILTRLTEHEKPIASVALSPTEDKILTGSEDNTAILWDFRGTKLHTLKGHEAAVDFVSFSSDGKYIFTCSADKTARIWDLEGNTLQVCKGHVNSVLQAAFSPDKSKILTFSLDNTLREWNVEINPVEVFRCSKRGLTLAAFSGDGENIITVSSSGNISIWNRESNQVRSVTVKGNSIFSFAYSGIGNRIYTGGPDSVRCYDFDLGYLNGFEAPVGGISSIAVSPDGKRILTGSYSKTTTLWNSDFTKYRDLSKHKGWVYAASFSQRGDKILTGSMDNTAILWNMKDTGDFRLLSGHVAGVMAVAFSPDGEHMLTGSFDKTARLWGKKGIETVYSHEGAVYSVAFSPNGRNVLTGSDDKTAQLWDLSGNPLQTFRRPEGIHSVSFSPDGKYVLTGSTDGTASLWKIKEPVDKFLSGSSHEVLSVSQKLKYQIVPYEDVLNSADVNEVIEAIVYYLSDLKIAAQFNIRKGIANKSSKLIAKVASMEPDTVRYRDIISYALICYRYDHSDILKDIVNRFSKKIVSFRDKQELVDSYNFYNNYCSSLDTLLLIFKFPEALITVSEALLKKTELTNGLRDSIYNSCLNLAFELLVKRRYQTARTAAETAEVADSTKIRNYSLLALSYLLNNQPDKANRIIFRFKNMPYSSHLDPAIKTMKDVILADISILEKKGIESYRFIKIREILK